MKSVIGIDLGTSSVKVLGLRADGDIFTAAEKIDILTPQPGYSEEDPEQWYESTCAALKHLADESRFPLSEVTAISFSGQMHGLVLLDKNRNVIHPAILWNDTRSSNEVARIIDDFGSKMVDITGNTPVEGYVLPKLLWIKKNRPEVWESIDLVMLPKDYLRWRLTGTIETEKSDATGTGFYDIKKGVWSQEILGQYGIDIEWLPPIVDSMTIVGTLLSRFATMMGFSPRVKVSAGAADNAAGAIGAGIAEEGDFLVSIGTSGVVLRSEGENVPNYNGVLQSECHAIRDNYYSMGVTLAAGHSLEWFRDTFFEDKTFEELTTRAKRSPIGANGILYTPYLTGERTPHFDAKARASFTGISDFNTASDFVRAVIEGITFSLNDILEIYRIHNGTMKRIVSIGGGAKSILWSQIQADIFNLPVLTLKNEEGPSLGAAILAALADQWFLNAKEAIKSFVKYGKRYEPIKENVKIYREIYQRYSEVYPATKQME